MIPLFRPLPGTTSSVASATDQPIADRLRHEARRRRRVTILFAVLLLSLAGVSQAAETALPPGVIEFSVTASTPDTVSNRQHPSASSTGVLVMDQANLVQSQVDSASGGALPLHRGADQWMPGRSGRPAYAQMSAVPANFDADADLDGWRGELTVRTADDVPLGLAVAYATFELTPRIMQFHGQHSVDAPHQPQRWTMPLRFNDQGIAVFKLPLRQRWDSPQEWRALVEDPPCGSLHVRVSIPGEGVFEAVTPVNLRDSVLVDTRWPYR